MRNERRPQMGKVKIQASTIFPAISHCTPRALFAAATPIIDVVMVCVVLRGIPNSEADKMTIEALVSAANPCHGLISTIRIPTFLTIFQPPMDVPIPMVMEQSRIIQSGT